MSLVAQSVYCLSDCNFLIGPKSRNDLYAYLLLFYTIACTSKQNKRKYLDLNEIMIITSAYLYFVMF
jgi:hypothetical protein